MYWVNLALSQKQALDVDPKAIQKINFTGSQDWAEVSKIFFIIKELKETILDFPGTGLI